MWLKHQSLGFFGFSLKHIKGRVEEWPRHEEVVDIHSGMHLVGDVLDAWWASLSWPDAQPLTGGQLDAWPNRLREGLALCREEWAAVMALLKWRAQGGK